MKYIPTSLRDRRIWYATEHSDVPATSCHFPPKRRLSPHSLSDLRPSRPEDYSDYQTAAKAVADHPHWLGGVGVRIAPPLLAIVICCCFQPSGTLEKPVRQLMNSLPGYWERGPRRDDVVGIILTSIPASGDHGWYFAYKTHVFVDALYDLTGESFRVKNSDTGVTNPDRLAQFYKDIHR